MHSSSSAPSAPSPSSPRKPSTPFLPPPVSAPVPARRRPSLACSAPPRLALLALAFLLVVSLALYAFAPAALSSLRAGAGHPANDLASAAEAAHAAQRSRTPREAHRQNIQGDDEHHDDDDDDDDQPGDDFSQPTEPAAAAAAAGGGASASSGLSSSGASAGASSFVARPADLCHVFGATGAPGKLWRFNSRALCLSSSVCVRVRSSSASDRFRAYLHASDMADTTCQLSDPAFGPSEGNSERRIDSQFGGCRELQRQLVTCAHGDGLQMNRPTCPEVVAGLDEVERGGNVLWLEDITILVPSYPYPANIYHYGNVIAMIAHVADHLPRLLKGWGLGNVHVAGGGKEYFRDGQVNVRKLNVVFRGPRNHNGWQNTLLDVIWKHRLERGGVEVTTTFASELEAVDHLCARNVVVLGRRGHVNVWFFPNGTEVPLDGNAVPVDAVEFKRAVYEAFDIDARLPRLDEGEEMLVSELPPLVLGYARRLGETETEAGNVHLIGTKRRYDDADEEWFVNMLKNETEATGVRLHMFTTAAEDSLRDQVTNIAGVGFVVGIHGANLVNAIFMHPFGALLEVFPGKADSPCYIAGANSGLAYYRHTSTEEASPAETGCAPDDKACATKPRQRLVKIGRQEDRDGVRKYVQDGLKHLRYLHDTFPDGIPVAYNEETAFYNIKTAK